MFGFGKKQRELLDVCVEPNMANKFMDMLSANGIKYECDRYFKTYCGMTFILVVVDITERPDMIHDFIVRWLKDRTDKYGCH